MNPSIFRTIFPALFAAVLLPIYSSAQVSPPGHSAVTDTIAIHKIANGFKYYHGGPRPLTPTKIYRAIRVNPEAAATFRRSRAPRAFGTVASYAGGFLIGYQIGAYVFGGETSPAMALVGAGLIGVSIPLAISENRNVRKAVLIYNDELVRPSTTTRTTELHIGATTNGIGLALSF